MPYTRHYVGYARELVFGTSPITDTNSTAYQLGITSDILRVPDPSVILQTLPPPKDNAEISGAWKSAFKLSSTLNIGVQDGILASLAMGKSVTSGVTAPFTHTLTCPTVDSGLLNALPSITLHVEDVGNSVPDFVRQFTGVKISDASFKCSIADGFLYVSADIMARKGERKTFTLTGKPQLIDPSTTGRMPFLFAGSSRKFDGSEISQLTSWELAVDNSIDAIYTYAVDGSGNDVSQYPSFLIESAVKKYRGELQLLVKDYNMWDELVNLINNKTFEATLTRSATNSLKFSATNCEVIDAPHPVPFGKGDRNFTATVRFIPQSLTVTVTDSISKSYYGES